MNERLTGEVVVVAFRAIAVVGWVVLPVLLLASGAAQDESDDRREVALTREAGPPPATAAPSVQPTETLVSFPGNDGTLHGWIWKPEGDGPFPAVLYNHGSERFPGSKPEIARIFVSSGYVFFVPHRRGQGRSPGPYIGDQIEAAAPSDRARLQVELLEAQVADQLAGFDFLKSLLYVSANAVAVAGCSYGGIQTILGAEANPGYRSAVDFAGGAMSWGNPFLRARLVRAVGQITIPVFLLQAANDYDLGPSNTLAAEFERLGKPYQMRIYPPYGITRDDGHGGFCSEGTEVWGPDVLSFVAASMPPGPAAPDNPT